MILNYVDTCLFRGILRIRNRYHEVLLRNLRRILKNEGYVGILGLLSFAPRKPT